MNEYVDRARSKWQSALTLWEKRMKWFRRGSEAEDKIVAQAADVILDGISDADLVGKVDAQHGRNLRDQLTVEQAQEMHRERHLRGFGWGRN